MNIVYKYFCSAIVLIAISTASYAQEGGKKVSLGKSAEILSQIKEKTGSATNSRKKAEIDLKVSSLKKLKGRVNYQQSSDEAEYIVGEIDDQKNGNFYLKVGKKSVEGHIVLRDSKKAYKYRSDEEGNAFIEEVDINQVVCIEYDKLEANAVNNDGTSSAVLAVPDLQSLPGANGCVLLDYDGHYVSGTPWNNGNPINAQPSGMSEAAILECWEMVTEDFRPFNINITTNEAVFNSYPKNRRMRCIITPTNTAAPGAGGVAYLNSFSWNDDTPCWVFITSSVKGSGEATSHEIGHTLSLKHDGRTSPSEGYYAGHGNWAPIMGVGYYEPITQWSKGEYSYANNTEDDLAKIVSSINGLGYRVDDHGNTISAATALVIDAAGNISAASNKGLIERSTDVDIFKFSTTGGAVSINFNPASRHADLDILVRLYNNSGTLLSTHDLSGLSSAISTTLVDGTYFLAVDGTGAGNAASTGYSDYASIGTYSISGIIPVGKANVSPTVAITSPSTGAFFSAPATIAVSANAADSDGTVSKVEFFNGAVKLGEDLTAPYSLSWKSVAAGSYSLTARATDNTGAVTTSAAVSVQVKAANVSPTVAITSPVSGTSFSSPATIAVSANAADSDGTVSKVEFFNGAVKLGEDLTAPYSFSWNSVVAGSYSLTARATDNTGAVTTSAAVSVQVKAANVFPMVAITSPASGAFFTAPATIAVSANAADSDGTVSKVEFFNGAVKVGEDLTAPYSFSWNSVAAGSYSLTARATDNTGAVTTSAAVSVQVKAANVSPTVAITSPASGTSFSSPATIAVSANAADSDGTVSKVEFFNGTVKLGEDLTAPYSFSWNSVAAGSYSLTARATDNTGAVTTSAAVSVQVKAANVSPTVAITSPASGASFTSPATIAVSANAADSDGTVSKVEFFNGAVKLGEDLTAPYSFSWNSVVAGSYSLTARATDNTGAVTTSAAVSVQVKAANVSPTVAITSPASGASFTSPATIALSANAADSDGTVSKVEFFNGAVKLGEDLTAPYSFSWNSVAAGSYSLTARATDNTGAVTTSDAVSVQVKAANVSPTVAITSPASGAFFTAPATIAVSANAADSDGTVSKVEFFNGAVKLGEDLTAPYSFSWNSVAAGSYSLTARATDNSGAVTTSAAVSITVISSDISYCSARGSSSRYEFIDYVGLAGINNTSGNNGGYGDFITAGTILAPGSSYTINFRPGFSGSSYYEYWGVWIDFNRDGDFIDSGELIVSGRSPGAGTFYSSFTVPSSAMIGKSRMRVAMKYGSAPTSCETFSYGEVEDYSIDLSPQSLTASPELPLSEGAELLSSDFSPEPEMQLHPNPARESLTITQLRVEDGAEGKIIDITGEVIKTFGITRNAVHLDIKDLPAGIYVVYIKSGRNEYSERFIKL